MSESLCDVCGLVHREIDDCRTVVEQRMSRIAIEIDSLREKRQELKAKVQELESWKAKYENENMALKSEMKVLKEQNDWYATKYDEHQCLENFLDDVFDSAYECNLDRPWKNLFQDYCEANAKKAKKEQG